MKRLERMVFEHTNPGRHRDEALAMLATHLKRFKPEIKRIECDRCHMEVDAVRWTNDNNEIVDSWGYLEATDNICHLCLDEGWIGDIFVPKKIRTQ